MAKYKPPMNYHNEAKWIFLKSIDNNKFIPNEYKEDLKSMITTHFMLMSQFIGTYELLFHREKTHYEEQTKKQP